MSVKQVNGPTQVSQVPFAHNHLHDLESLWWVAVWIVFYNHFCDSRQPQKDPLSDPDEVERQLGVARILFPPSMENSGRLSSFLSTFVEVYANLPKHKAVICFHLEVLRAQLVQSYSAVESTLPHSIDLTAFKDDIYERFRKVFTLSRNGCSHITLAFIPDIHTQLKDLRSDRGQSQLMTQEPLRRKGSARYSLLVNCVSSVVK